MDEFVQQLASMRGAKTLLLCHNHADSDAIGAAYALSKYLNGTVGVPCNVAAHTRGLIQKLDLEIVFQPDPNAYDYVIILDTANASQLLHCLPNVYWLIDHHPDNALLEYAEHAVYDLVSSTSQLVYRLLKDAGAEIDKEMALALCAGVLTDTIHFHKGDAEAFRTFGELLELSGLTFEEIQGLYIVDERKDRKAIIQAALQAQRIDVNGFEVLATQIDINIPTFAARALFDLGADISVVGYTNGADMEIRMYLRHELYKQFGIYASDLLKQVPDIQRENVWGYSHFAGYRSRGELKQVMQSILATFQEVLK
jgi:phosphoesterase RecJ-like protein